MSSNACYDHYDGQVYCENCGIGLEPEAQPQETDYPLNCDRCGCLLDYTLTGHGVSWILSQIVDNLDDPAGSEHIVPDGHYKGMRHIEIVRDWVSDLCWYSLEPEQHWILRHFLAVTREPPQAPAVMRDIKKRRTLRRLAPIGELCQRK